MPNNVTQIINPQLIAQYQANGLTSISDNNDVMPRDKAGNIIITAETSSVSYLVIDPVTELYTMKSALDVFDTQFRYFSFPVTDISSDDINIDVNVGEILTDALSELINQTLTIPYSEDNYNQPEGWRRLPTTAESSWFTNNPNDRRSGFQLLPFSGGNVIETGRFEIDDNIIDSIRNSGKTIKFEIQIQAQPVGDPPLLTLFQLKLNRDSKVNGSARAFQQNVQIDRYGVSYPVLRITYVIDPTDLVDRDIYEVYAVASNPAGYLRDQTWWKISVTDDIGIYGASYSDDNTVTNNTNTVTNNTNTVTLTDKETVLSNISKYLDNVQYNGVNIKINAIQKKRVYDRISISLSKLLSNQISLNDFKNFVNSALRIPIPFRPNSIRTNLLNKIIVEVNKLNINNNSNTTQSSSVVVNNGITKNDAIQNIKNILNATDLPNAIQTGLASKINSLIDQWLSKQISIDTVKREISIFLFLRWKRYSESERVALINKIIPEVNKIIVI